MKCLDRRAAAAHLGISPSTFDGWVRSGLLPPPLPGTRRWYVRALDAALDRAAGLAPPLSPAAPDGAEPSPYDAWKARQAAGS
jgi:predicted DNA-binding transcriptional regulator AlpA